MKLSNRRVFNTRHYFVKEKFSGWIIEGKTYWDDHYRMIPKLYKSHKKLVNDKCFITR